MGVNLQHVTFTNTTMESEKFICVRETGAQNNLLIVDMATPQQPLRRPITADSAVMNPVKKIIALKAAVAAATPGAAAAGNSLQIFDLETKSKLKAYTTAEPVVYWKWISPTKLGLVTVNAVYHWDLEVRQWGRSAFLRPVGQRC